MKYNWSKIETVIARPSNLSFKDMCYLDKENFKCLVYDLIDILEDDVLTEEGNKQIRSVIPTLLNTLYDDDTFWRKADE
ncbi:hypothetical protein [Lactobacillus hominis]|uniref:Uncharacterized protein n=1 Tax=Lactobacillus hominis DSM 23910 = CRBIP 24.179 TaxID=1423758 RepID=I7KGV1_9LACO|nr:hypothetical protein [Lactobacillus hominis]KRM85864.1 hypothetical protein FC41_GL000054 [Lactobacillus hominis DSM 23910 = CRBIP 24.179]MCT3348899.1 hypothetical protein [Lactobacillus hominis]CCI81585.1 Protein of unknown function [Lactobacillus hominis DSM 23910 = CRBIP 24.179]